MRQFCTLFLIFLLAELGSYAAFFYLTLNTVGFFVIVGAALILSLRRLEYGLYFVLADLILGGKSGQLFSFEYEGFLLSLRMALFIVVMAVWVSKLVCAKKATIVAFFAQPMLRWWEVFGLAVGWGIVVGLARGNDFGNLFLDVNGYFYGAMVLPFLWTTKYEFDTDILKLSMVFLVATTVLALKTLFAVYIFTHAGNNFIAANLVPFYRWVRDTGVGEITWLPGNFARVFFQSQIYNVAAFFVLLTREEKGKKGWALLTLNAAVILVSLSRSFWVGVAIGVVVLGIGQLKRIRQIGQDILITGIAAIILIFVVARFPLPPPSVMDLSLAAQSRLVFEQAAASRWNLLPEIWKAVRERPIVGSGFGRTVTYISNDPRIREVNLRGEYTTYAFEWGWLDFWLKLGLIGLIGPIGLILALMCALYRKARLAGLPSTELALVLGLASLASIHFFTPYLNHPLGIGILILATLQSLGRG